MKKSKLNKFATQKLINTATIHGGANKSDVDYTDSKKKGEWWGWNYDTVAESLVDITQTSASKDKP